ncbi:MAG: hypothetical protein F4X83_00580 [Chloroflexi bacterium]|nr:hypothetical protein [Chloroflexota bacterium]
MAADPLCWEELSDHIAVIEEAGSVDDRLLTDALVEISSSIYEAQHMDRGLAPGTQDGRVLGEVLRAVAAASDVLVERFDLPAVRMATSAGPQRGELSPATRLLWKPVGSLWTAPVVEPASAWALWARKTGNARMWDRQLRYESPPRAARVVVDSLANADNLVGNRSFEQTAHGHTLDGVSRIDFTWRCVLEAECSALRGERSPSSYPCALGTESSIWLTSPEPVSEHAQDDTVTRNDPYERSNWFVYR